MAEAIETLVVGEGAMYFTRYGKAVVVTVDEIAATIEMTSGIGEKISAPLSAAKLLNRNAKRAIIDPFGTAR